MGNYHEPGTWRAFLGQLIEDPKEKARLAKAVRVRPITLQRWAEGASRPREENIRALRKQLPAGSYPLFMRLLLRDFPELLKDELPEDHFHQSIPGEFYERALSNLALTPQPIYRQSMQDLLLQQIREHLDPDQHGLAISLALCVPPRPFQKVRSLREIGGLGTPPWPYDLGEKPMFLGAESLAGYAVGHMRSYCISSKDEMTFFPANWTEFECSAAAFPILRQARVVGALIISSTQEFFFTEPRLAVIEKYSYLISCIFETEDSYPIEQIELRVMPAYARQIPFFQSYNRRVSLKFSEAMRSQNPITLQQVRQQVWQEIEEELLQIPQEVKTPG
jgi:hypothetical protein